MERNCHISRRLHEEHEATLALWTRLEANPDDEKLRLAAAQALEHELDRHFVFEERELFPRLAQAGEGDIGELLTHEHAAIRQAGGRFMALVKMNPSAPEIRPLALELAERLVSHVQKEEMSLLPSLDDLIDEATDYELTEAYMAL